MSTIRAIYEGGVFRPIEPVDLPERSVVRIITEAVGPPETAGLSLAHDEGLDAIYEVLSRRYSGGDPYVSERHNEHQP